MSGYQTRKAERVAFYQKNVAGWKLRPCAACAGTGRYDIMGSPKCSACNGIGKGRYKPITHL